jgi:hypothetical protein
MLSFAQEVNVFPSYYPVVNKRKHFAGVTYAACPEAARKAEIVGQILRTIVKFKTTAFPKPKESMPGRQQYARAIPPPLS